MDKDKKNNIVLQDSDINIPLLIKNKAFRHLKADRAQNFRTELVTFLNGFYPTNPLDYKTWKFRFNNPLKIPKKNLEKTLQIMEEALAWSLQLMINSLEDGIKKDSIQLNDLKEKIKSYQDE